MLFLGRLNGVRLLLLATVTVGAPLTLYSGCRDDRLPGAPPLGGSTPDRRVSSGPCTPGAERPCGTTLGEHDGVLSCYHGTSTCIDGTWSECSDGSVENLSAKAVASGSQERWLSLSQPTTCATNPCDPYCQNYDEQPDGGYHSATDGSIPIYTWQGGTLSGFPGGLVKKGIQEPCTTGSDCQFNTYCSGPDDGTCSHSVCVAGDALKTGCDSTNDGCVARVCAVDPTCCAGGTPAQGCDHDPCARGAALKASCNDCVAQICQQMPSCCNTTSGVWSAACVALVSSTCGQSCGCNANEKPYNGHCYSLHTTAKNEYDAGLSCAVTSSGDWHLAYFGSPTDASELAFVASLSSQEMWVWPANWQYTYITTGETLATTWNPLTQRQYVCEGPPEVMGSTGSGVATAWTSSCVDRVASACDAKCDPTTPSNAAGECVPWYPGDTDATCSGIDLSVGAPCNGTIPVCNHGTQDAPAGIRIIHFPANSDQYPKCDPDQTHPQMYECSTSEPIPAGDCIDVTTCPELVGNREIMVNPPGTAHVDESSCQDNWSLYNAGGCGASVCAEGTLIGGASAKCSIPFDTTAQIDTSSITVTYVSGAGAITTLSRVSRSSSCTASGGYYLNSTTNPTGIVLCPATCSVVQADPAGTVSASVGCAGTPITSPATFTQVYTPTCGYGTSLQWGFMAYEASTPGDSNVVFRVRTADTESDLASATFVDIATATSTPNDTQNCPMSGAVSGCPLDLFATLGDQAAQLPALEVQITLNPGSNGETATLTDWQITYSCPPSL